MDAKKLFQTVFEPLGIMPRLFLVDYLDKSNNCRNNESVLVGNADDDFIKKEIIKDYAAQGFTVYSIIELLHGYTSEQLESLLRKDRQQGLLHMRPVYLDSTIEKQTRYANKS